MTTDTKETCHVHVPRDWGTMMNLDRDIKEGTKVITQKLDEGQYDWLARAYMERAGAYMGRAGAHGGAALRYCRRCSAHHRRENWDYEAEINDYSRAIEDYMNVTRLKWDWENRSRMSSDGEELAGIVRNFLLSPLRHGEHGEPTEKQLIIRSKMVQNQNACVNNLFKNYELSYYNNNGLVDVEIPNFLRVHIWAFTFIALQSACLCKAEACFEAKRYESAVEEYTKLIRLSPEESHISAWVYPAVYIDRARTLLCLGKNDEAEADFEEALRIDPGVKEVKASLFRLPEMTGT